MRRLEERRQDSSEEYYDEEEDGGMERALTPGELEGHIPVTKAEGDKVDQVCSICVDEFRPEEEIRTLPACLPHIAIAVRAVADRVETHVPQLQ